MAAFNSNPPTAFATSPSTHIHHHPAETAADVNNENIPLSTPSRRRRDVEIDPELYTPMKRMRTLYAGLSSTSSGSFLVSKTLHTSSTPILAPVLEAVPPTLPRPDWSLAYGHSVDSYKTRQHLQEENELLRTNLRWAHTISCAQDGIIEGSSATMIVQDLTLRKLNGALHGKETEKASNRTLVIDASKGQCYSQDSIREGIFEQEERKKAAAAQKRSKADGRAAKKEAQAKLDEEWKRIKMNHEDAVKCWKTDCEKLASEGVPKKNWPKGPIHQRKPKLPPNLEAVADEDDVDDEEEDEHTID
ncbi:hypothetical protein BDZ97DRAFT_1654424 [Flammula alnicola]|nr:hypothetical protein BDZ97DRAFT_1654424 [Flammula alnicola]